MFKLLVIVFIIKMYARNNIFKKKLVTYIDELIKSNK